MMICLQVWLGWCSCRKNKNHLCQDLPKGSLAFVEGNSGRVWQVVKFHGLPVNKSKPDFWWEPLRCNTLLGLARLWLAKSACKQNSL